MIPKTMTAVLLTGHGGIDKLDYRTDVRVPEPRPGEVLIRVSAAGVNNTDINTRIGWYSRSVGQATGTAGAKGFQSVDEADASWSGKALQLPRIQGADCCGRIVSVGGGVGTGGIPEQEAHRETRPHDPGDRRMKIARIELYHRPVPATSTGSRADGEICGIEDGADEIFVSAAIDGRSRRSIG